MSNNIFDTHAHYTDKRFDPDREALLASLPGRGVSAVLCCGSDLPDSRAALALAGNYDWMYAACGVHPHEAGKISHGDLVALRELLQEPKCVAVGEIGLDYHYDFAPRDVQKEVFRAQLSLAQELDLPVIVHDRKAHEDTLRILREFNVSGVVHCFSGSVEFMRELTALGYYIGLGGAVTFKNAKKPIEAAKSVPIDRLLLETDAPYMAPEPCRGKRCDSAHIAYTAEKIAAVRGMDTRELIDRCGANARALFRP